ncbi:MAG TPA: beta-ketoacyl-ACP reductase [Myxococcales bacterium]|jgi:3-oxoacyl-(acyl-carrier-protein) reductase
MAEQRVGLVTGSSGALGRAIARRLAQDGWAVALHYREHREETEALQRKLASELGARTCVVQADVRHQDQVNRMFAELQDALGPLALAVNNAGIVRDKVLWKLSEEDWDAVLDTSLRGAFHVCKAAAAGMRERKWGRIVNVSSIVGAMGNLGQTNYAAAKAGLIGFTKALAKELARSNVTVNAICPGFMESPMVRGVPEEAQKKLLEQIPLGRFGEPEAIGEAVAFLAGRGGDYITGQVLHVNGGMYV